MRLSGVDEQRALDKVIKSTFANICCVVRGEDTKENIRLVVDLYSVFREANRKYRILAGCDHDLYSVNPYEKL
jgi:hypothetical protein